MEKDTKQLISEFLSLGFKAIVVCVKAELLDESFVGRDIDADFIGDLPPNVDPCGENGEFHTFCYDGPIFKPLYSSQLVKKYIKNIKPQREIMLIRTKKQWGFGFATYCLLTVRAATSFFVSIFLCRNSL